MSCALVNNFPGEVVKQQFHLVHAFLWRWKDFLFMKTEIPVVLNVTVENAT
jgi:hypothetical protein